MENVRLVFLGFAIAIVLFNIFSRFKETQQGYELKGVKGVIISLIGVVIFSPSIIIPFFLNFIAGLFTSDKIRWVKQEKERRRAENEEEFFSIFCFSPVYTKDDYEIRRSLTQEFLDKMLLQASTIKNALLEVQNPFTRRELERMEEESAEIYEKAEKLAKFFGLQSFRAPDTLEELEKIRNDSELASEYF